MSRVLEQLWGAAVGAVGSVDASFLPDGEQPFEAAVLAAQQSYAALNLQALLAQVMCGTRSDGAGDIYCPAFELGASSVAVVQWHHDEYLAWAPAAVSFAQLDSMLSVLSALDELDDADPDDVAMLFDEKEGREARLATLDDDVREVLARWPNANPTASYDVGSWREALEMLVEEEPLSADAALLQRASERLQRARWITEVLCGNAPTTLPSETEVQRHFAALDLENPSALQPGDAIIAMWTAWFFGRDDIADTLCTALSKSPSSLVSDAARLVRAARLGTTRLGKASFTPIRDQLLKRRAERAKDADGKHRIRFMNLPRLDHWVDALSDYTGLEEMVCGIGELSDEVANFQRLRRLEAKGTAPLALGRLEHLEVLHCGHLPEGMSGLAKLRELRLSYVMAEDPLGEVRRLAALESLYLVAAHRLDTSGVASLQALKQFEVVASDAEATVFSPELAALSNLETIVFRGKLGELPADWSGATSLREVRLQGVLPADYRALATAPNLERLVLEPYTTPLPTPQLEDLTNLKSIVVEGALEDEAATARALAKVSCTQHVGFKVAAELPDLSGLDVAHVDLHVFQAVAWAPLATLLRSMTRLEALSLRTIGVPTESVDGQAWPQLKTLNATKAPDLRPLITTAGHAPNLERLILGDAKPDWIPNLKREGWLDGLDSCRKLHTAEVAGTLLREQDIAALAALPALERLVARKCEVATWPDGFKQLRHLDLRDNALASLPTLPSALETLRLGGTQVANLDNTQAPRALRHLDLASPALVHVPPWLAELSSLEELELNGASLDINQALALVASLPALKRLTLRDVHCDGHPRALLGMTKLEKLHIVASNFNARWPALRIALPDTDILLA